MGLQTSLTHQQTLNFMMLSWWYPVRSSVEIVPYSEIERVGCVNI